MVRTSHDAALFRTDDLIRVVQSPYRRIPIDGLKEAQGEGVAFDGNMLYLSSEGRPWNRAGRFVSLRCDWAQAAGRQREESGAGVTHLHRW